jgi:hypothetical protein
MAGFYAKTFRKDDDYMTPRSAWEDIKDYIPRDKIIWEPFYGDGKSGEYLREMGFDVIHEDLDFFEHDKGQVVVSNPPFTLAKDILTRLKELKKPFILILPSSKINTLYFRELFVEGGIQLIIPKKRIQFLKTVNGVVPEDYKSTCNFDCFYYAWGIGLERDIIWLK